MLTALVVACAVAIMASATLLGIRDPGNRVLDVPDVSRTLVRRAIIEVPDRQHVQMLAYTRRADELVRLRDLPTAPVRAVIEYAERAQALEPADAPAATPTEVAVVAPSSEPVAVASLPPEPATDAPAAKPEAVAPASEPASSAEHGDVRLATAESESGELAAVEPLGEPVAGPKPHRAKSARRHRRKPHIARATGGIPPSATTGFPVDPAPTASETRANNMLLNARLQSGP